MYILQNRSSFFLFYLVKQGEKMKIPVGELYLTAYLQIRNLIFFFDI